VGKLKLCFKGADEVKKIAWLVDSDDFDGEEIIFAELLEDTEYNDGQRAPEYDQFADLGYVPPMQLLSDGWYLCCDECGRRSDCEEEEDDDGNPLLSVEAMAVDSYFFCGRQCYAGWARQKTDWEARKVDAVESLHKFLPYPGIAHISVFGTMDETCVDFTFPGSKHRVSWIFGEKSFTVNRGDVEALNLWRGKPAMLCYESAIASARIIAPDFDQLEPAWGL
jgi:hypothetical protein